MFTLVNMMLLPKGAFCEKGVAASRLTRSVKLPNDARIVMRPLPVGSSFEAASTTFYWQPAAGFLGSYELVFVRGTEQIRVRVFVDAPRSR